MTATKPPLALVCACKTGMQEGTPDRGAAIAPATGQAAIIEDNAKRMLAQGRDVFRDETFGSEDFFGGKLQLHRAIAGQKNGGVGGGVSPKTALSVGLKVDAERLPAPVAQGIKSGAVSLDDPAALEKEGRRDDAPVRLDDAQVQTIAERQQVRERVPRVFFE